MFCWILYVNNYLSDMQFVNMNVEYGIILSPKINVSLREYSELSHQLIVKDKSYGEALVIILPKLRE